MLQQVRYVVFKAALCQAQWFTQFEKVDPDAQLRWMRSQLVNDSHS
jgi:hypothetical protein